MLPFIFGIINAQNQVSAVIKHIDKDIFVNCDAGLSRSPGIVVALNQIFNGKDTSYNFPHHNKFVKNKIRDVWYTRIWRNKLKEEKK